MKNLLLVSIAIPLLFFPKLNFAQATASDLSTASSFALFTGDGAFTNIGATTVTGNIGTNIGAFTGFPPGVVNGQIHVADATSASAAQGVTAAYNDLRTRSGGLATAPVLGNGQILTPGIFTIGQAASLNGNLILDAQNNTSAIFIIQIDGALSTTSGSTITLLNGASASNVFFQVNGRVDLGTNSFFRGNILSNGAINLEIGASLVGRGLAVVGAITLNTNNVQIPVQIQGPGCSITSFFRTRATGNWNDINTWECSPDNVNFSNATVTPDFNSNTITIRNTHTVTITANLTIDQTTINSGGAVIVNPNIVLILNDGTGTDLTISSGGTMTIKSISTGTGIIGNSTGTTSGNVIVERFISAAFARNAWRLLTAPLRSTTGTNGTIFANWQNNGVNTPGIDTRVTDPAFVPGSGLDEFTINPSMRWWNGTAYQNVVTTNNPAITPLFTTDLTAANRSYFTFIDGDRTLPVGGPAGGPPAGPNTTTLSATGSLQTGDQAFATNVAPDGFALIGNPYASPVDLNKLRLDNTASNIKSTFYYWDPYLTGAFGWGAYVTVSYDGMGNETITPAGAAHTRFLQSGQAMFVQTKNPSSGTPTLTFKETQKDVTNVNNIFRTASGKIESIGVNLKIVTSNTATLVDGVITKFDDTYAAAVDNYDAAKLYNIGESIAFIRDNKALSIELRPLIKSNDVLFLNLEKLKAGITYQFEINPTFSSSVESAYLVDNYLKTTTPLDINKATTVNFTINSDAASTGANRFSISFAKPAIVQNSKPGILVYPNPVANGVINLKMSNMPQGVYNVRVINNQGQTVLIKQIIHSAGNNTEAIQLGKGVKGAYHLEVTKPDKTKFSTKLIAN